MMTDAIRGLGQAVPVVTSLEDRLEYLQRNVDRLSKIRSGLESIVERLSMSPNNVGASPASPPSSDLTGRFGDAITYMANNLDEIERLSNRLNEALYSPGVKQVATQYAR